MEALLLSLEELIPYSCARVLVPEGGPHVLALGERQISEPPKTSPKYHPGHPLTLLADKSPFLNRMLEGRKSILIPDTKKEEEWQTFLRATAICVHGSPCRSWHRVSIWGSCLSATLIRIAITKTISGGPSCLSIPAAAAIQNARLFAKADVYASELENASLTSGKRKTRLSRQRWTGKSLRINSRRFFAPANSVLHHDRERGAIHRCKRSF